MKKKKITALLALSAAAVLTLAVSAYAEGEVAQIGEQKYSTLQQAVNAAQSGDTITLIDNLTEDNKITATIEIASDDNLTLDLNGKTIDTDLIGVEGRTFNIHGTMTVKGNGMINCTSFGVFDVKTGGSLTLEDGTYNSAGYRSGTTGSGAVLRTRPGSNAEVKDGVKIFCEKGGAVYSEGYIKLGACELISTSHNGMKGDNNSNLFAYCTQVLGEGELNETTVRGVQGGLYVGGNATINGGSYVAADLDDDSYTGSKAFYGLYISNDASVTINDGTFAGGQAGGNYAVLNSDNDVGMELGNPVIINGGTYNGKVGSLDGTYGHYGITAYGGTFEEDPKNFIASGYVSVKKSDSEMYEVVQLSETAAATGTYMTAVNDSGEYDQMELFEVNDVSSPVTYTVSDGVNSKVFTYDYANVDSITKLGLIVTDIPQDKTVTITMGGQDNE